MARLGTAWVDVQPDLDNFRRKVAAEMRPIAREMSQNFSPTVNTRQVDRSLMRTGRNSENLAGRLLRLKLVAAALSFGPAVSGLNAMAAGGVAAAGSLTPLVGLLATLPSLASAAGQAMATVKLGTAGVGDALKAGIKAQVTAASDSGAAMERQRASAERIRGALEALSDANIQEERAQRAQTQAVKDARKEMEDLRAAAEGGATAQKRAALTLRDARKELASAEVGADAGKIADARLAVTEAEENVAATRRRVTEARKELAEAERAGIDGMPQVVAANEAVTDAQKSTARAAHDLTIAQQDASQATDKQSASATAYDQALAQLSPRARQFVKTLLSYRPALKELQATSAEGLFPGVERGLAASMGNFDVAKNAIGGTASEIGRIAENAGNFLGRQDVGRDLATQASRNDVTIRRFGATSLFLADALRHVTISAGPLVDRLTLLQLGWAKNIAEEAKAGRESGRTAAYFERTGDILERLLSITGHLGSGIRGIFRAGREDGDAMWVSVDRLAGRFDRWVNSVEGQNALRRWFADGRDTLHEMADAVGDMVARFRELRGEGRTAFDAFAIMGAEATAKFLSLAAETLARRAPAVAEAFLHGFFAANAWGRALVGIWLLRKMGGLRAFMGLGAKSGGAFGAAFAATSSTAAAKGIGGKGFAAKVGAGLKGSIPGLAASIAILFGPEIAKAANKIGEGRGPQTKQFNLPKTPGAGFGHNVLDQFGQLGRQFGEVTPGKMFRALSGGGGIEDPEKKLRQFGDTAEQTFARLKRARDTGGLQKLVADARALAVEFPKDGRALEGFARAVERAGGRIRTTFGDRLITQNLRSIRSAGRINLGALRATVETNMGAIRSLMRRYPEQGSRAMREHFKGATGAMRRLLRDGKVSAEGYLKEIARLAEVHSKGSRTNIGRNFKGAVRAIKTAMRDGLVTTDQGLAAIRRLSLKALGMYGFSGKEARKLFKAGVTADDVAGGKDLSGALQRGPQGLPTRAGGGLVGFGRPGDKGRDTIPVNFGGQRIAVGSGEVGAVFNRHQLPILNARLSDLGGLPGLFRKVKTKHFMASGGLLGRAGFAPGGIVPIPGEPGEFIHRSILGDVMKLIRKFKLDITDGYAPTGHAASGEHPKGLAIDAIPNFRAGGNWDLIGRLAKWAEPSQNQPRTPFRWVGYTGDSGHGPGDHIHLSWGGKGGGLGGLPDMVAKAIKVKMGGPGAKSPLGGIVGGALKGVAGGVNRRLAQIAESSGGAGGIGDIGVGLGKGAATRAQMERWAKIALTRTGIFPPSAENIEKLLILARKESGWIVDSMNNWDSNAKAGNPSGGLMHVTRDKMKGASLFDPVLNMMASIRYQKERYGGLITHSPYAQGGLLGSISGMLSGLPGFAPGGLPGRLRTTLKTLQTGKTKPRRKALTGLLNKFKKMGLPKSLQDTMKRHDSAAGIYGDLASRAGQLTVDNPVEGGDPILGKVNGLTEAHYLSRQIGELFNLRNALVRAHEIIAKHRAQVAKLIAQAKKALEGVRKKIKAARKHPKRNKKQIAALMRVQAAIKDRILPSLKDRNTTLGDTRETLVSDLQEVQGVGSPMGVLGRLPAVGILGGSIFESQIRLRELNQKQPANVTDKTDDPKADLLAQMLREANLRTAVSERHFDVLRNTLPPFGGSFLTGGTVPGPAGAPRTIIAHGQERVIPVGGDSGDVNVVMQIAPGMEWLRQFIRVEVNQETRKSARTGARVLPGGGGGGLRG